MNFFQNFFVEPIKLRSFALANFRFAQLLHERSNGLYDHLYQSWCTVVRPKRKLPSSARLSADALEGVVSELKHEGCKILPFMLSADELAAIRDFAFTTPAYSDDITANINISSDNIPTDRGRYYWPMHKLVQCPAVKNLIADSSFHAIAQEYLGAAPVLSHVTLWLDPVYGGFHDPHIYHYDNDGPGFLKFFFYITDVEADTGAHRFIRQSHSHRKPEPFKLSRRYDEDKLLSFYGAEKEVVFAAPAGTIIAEDTAGFHRGTRLQRGYRLLMQFQFSLIDIPHDEDLLGVTKQVPAPELHPEIARIARKFFR